MFQGLRIFLEAQLNSDFKVNPDRTLLSVIAITFLGRFIFENEVRQLLNRIEAMQQTS